MERKTFHINFCDMVWFKSNNHIAADVAMAVPVKGGLNIYIEIGWRWHGVQFEVGGRWGKMTPFLKLVRIIIETWNFVRKYTHIFSFRKYTFQYQVPLNSADVSMFCKKLVFFGKNGTFTQSNSVRVVSDIF